MNDRRHDLAEGDGEHERAGADERRLLDLAVQREIPPGDDAELVHGQDLEEFRIGVPQDDFQCAGIGGADAEAGPAVDVLLIDETGQNQATAGGLTGGGQATPEGVQDVLGFQLRPVVESDPRAEGERVDTPVG